MSDKEVKITYETLFDILRREKNNENLQKLPPEFYEDTLNYLQDKFKVLEESKKKQDYFSIVDKEKTDEDLISIRKILKELYNRREKKIIDIARDTAIINVPIGNTDNMLDYELELFNRLVKIFKQFRIKILDNFLEGKSSTYKDNNFEETLKNESISENNEEKEDVMVIFTHEVPQFVGRELEVYGPFKKDEEFLLPKEIAEILIDKGRAKIIE